MDKIRNFLLGLGALTLLIVSVFFKGKSKGRQQEQDKAFKADRQRADDIRNKAASVKKTQLSEEELNKQMRDKGRTRR